MSDYPIENCVETAEKIIEGGGEVFQKFTCEKCSSRQTIDEPNVFYTSGKCEECNHVTDIRKSGCNYLAILRVRRTETGKQK